MIVFFRKVIQGCRLTWRIQNGEFLLKQMDAELKYLLVFMAKNPKEFEGFEQSFIQLAAKSAQVLAVVQRLERERDGLFKK